MNDLFEQDIKDTSLAVNDRISAALFDYLLFGAVILIFSLIFGRKVGPNEYAITGPLALIPLIYYFLYFVVFEFFFQGSPGKKLLKLRVVSLDGSQIGFFQICLRRVCDILDIIWCFGLLALLLIKKTVNNQRIGDMCAKTIVVKGIT